MRFVWVLGTEGEIELRITSRRKTRKHNDLLNFYKHVERTVSDIKNQTVIKFLVFKKWISDAKWI